MEHRSRVMVQVSGAGLMGHSYMTSMSSWGWAEKNFTFIEVYVI